MNNIKLRDYQLDAVNAALSEINNNKTTKSLIEAPTGSGKSYIIAELCRLIHDSILVVCHLPDIAESNMRLYSQSFASGDDYGICSDKISSKRDNDSRVVFGSTLSCIGRFNNQKRIIIIDEAHSAGDNLDLSINKLIKENAGDHVIMLTATPFRLDQGILSAKPIYSISYKQLMDDGRIIKCITPDRDDNYFSGSAIDIYEIISDISANIINRKKVMIFCPNISTVDIVYECLTDIEVKAVKIHSKISNKDNDAAIRSFEDDDECKVIVCGSMLTTGYDNNKVDCVGLIFKTESLSKYIQVIGRGMRPNNDSDIPVMDQDCLILDYSDNISRFSLPPLFDKSELKNGLNKVKEDDEFTEEVDDIELNYDDDNNDLKCEQCGTVATNREWFCSNCFTALKQTRKYCYNASYIAKPILQVTIKAINSKKSGIEMLLLCLGHESFLIMPNHSGFAYNKSLDLVTKISQKLVTYKKFATLGESARAQAAFCNMIESKYIGYLYEKDGKYTKLKGMVTKDNKVIKI